jgi:hypothetical protein
MNIQKNSLILAALLMALPAVHGATRTEKVVSAVKKHAVHIGAGLIALGALVGFYFWNNGKSKPSAPAATPEAPATPAEVSAQPATPATPVAPATPAKSTTTGGLSGILSGLNSAIEKMKNSPEHHITNTKIGNHEINIHAA